MIEVVCGNCGAQMKFEDEYKGQTATCPGCQAQLKIEDAGPGTSDQLLKIGKIMGGALAAGASAAATAAKEHAEKRAEEKRRREEEGKQEEEEARKRQEEVRLREEERKKPRLVDCPACGKQVSSQASSCPLCGQPMAEPEEPAPAAPEENSVEPLKFRPSRAYYFRGYALAILSVPFAVAVSFLVSKFGLLVIPVGVVYVAVREIQRMVTLYVLDATTLVKRTGLFSIEEKIVRLQDVRSVAVSQGLFERLFNCGTIMIATAGTSGYEMILAGIANFRRIKELIDERRG